MSAYIEIPSGVLSSDYWEGHNLNGTCSNQYHTNPGGNYSHKTWFDEQLNSFAKNKIVEFLGSSANYQYEQFGNKALFDINRYPLGSVVKYRRESLMTIGSVDPKPIYLSEDFYGVISQSSRRPWDDRVIISYHEKYVNNGKVNDFRMRPYPGNIVIGRTYHFLPIEPKSVFGGDSILVCTNWLEMWTKK